MSQVALAGLSPGTAPTSFTISCAGGGSIVITLDPFTPGPTNVFRSSSRAEYRDCKNQSVTINGDPYLESSAEHVFASGPGSDATSTMRTTGGLRMDANGVQGRVKFDCTMTSTFHLVPGSTTTSTPTWSGTMTIEQPIGSTPVVRPCGPA